MRSRLIEKLHGFKGGKVWRVNFVLKFFVSTFILNSFSLNA